MNGRSEIYIALYSLADMVSARDPVLTALAEDLPLAPQKCGMYEPYKLVFPSEEVRQLWLDIVFHKAEFGDLGGERKRPFSIVFDAQLERYPLFPFYELRWSADIRVLDLPNAVARIEALFRRLVLAFQPHCGFAFHSGEFERQNTFPNPDNPQNPTIAFKRPHHSLRGLFWLNYFGPPYLSPFFLRKEALSEVDPPVEPLGPGVLLKLAPSPLDMLRPEFIERAERTKRLLGEDLFYDKHHPDRVTRAPAVSIPEPVKESSAPPKPFITDAPGFIAAAAERARSFYERHGLEMTARPTFVQARQVLRLVEKELSPGLPDLGGEALVADATAVLGELILQRLGGRWTIDDVDPYVITGCGEAVYPLDRVLKRALDDPQAHLYPWFHDLVKGTLPPPLRPSQVAEPAKPEGH